MSKPSMCFKVFLVALGLLSMVSLGGNAFAREAERRECAQQPHSQFVEIDEWHRECRTPEGVR